MRIGVVGATGFAGSEVVRWCLAHPELEVVTTVSTSRTGLLSDAVPALLGCTELRLEPFDPAALALLDAVVLAVPHGASAPLVGSLERHDSPLIVDLSADHRHAPGWVYGMAEHMAESLAGARRVAVPGCFATAVGMALAPLAKAGVLAGPIHVAAATGSTGVGASPKAASHHPLRAVNMAAYKVLSHQHVPEIRRFLGLFGPVPELLMVPLSAPVDRGIFAVCFVPLDGGALAAPLFADAAAQSPRTRLRPQTPQLRLVRGTGFCDLTVHQEGTTAVVLSAIDNLGMGAAAQAVACLERALGITSVAAVPACTP